MGWADPETLRVDDIVLCKVRGAEYLHLIAQLQLERLGFTLLAGGHVRQLWEQSTDGGKSWTVAFDGLYVPRKQP